MNNTTLAPDRLSIVTGSLIAAQVPVLSDRTRTRFVDALRQTGYLSTFELHNGDPACSASGSSRILEILRRLFLAGIAITREEADSALPNPIRNELTQAGFLAEESSGIRSLFQIQVYRGLIITADFLSQSGPSDLVLPIGPSGRYLAASTVRRRVRSALDLGCGCGIQALLAARHTDKVTATDINPRALALTALNAQFNSIDNIEILEGSYLEPAAGRVFDLITCNLPYVITPENKFLYRDSGEPGDQSIWRVVHELPRHLAEGGYAHVMVNWTHAASQSWWQAFRTRISGLGADAWLMCHQTLEPEPYARMWSDFKHPDTGHPDNEKLSAWLAWYRSAGIRRISMGMLTLRGRTAANHWHCATEVRTAPTGETGEQLYGLFEAQDAQRRFGSIHQLLEAVFVRQNTVVEPGSVPGSFKARTLNGYVLQRTIHSTSAHVLERLDGATDLRTAVRLAGEKSNFDPARDTDAILRDFQMLLNFGMIQPL